MDLEAVGVVELVQGLQDDHYVRREHCAQRLAGLGSAAAVAILGLGRELEDINRHAREAAADALGQLSVAEVWGVSPGSMASAAVPELVRRLADMDPMVRRNASRPLEQLYEDGAIGEVGAAAWSAMPELVRRLDDESWLVREAAAKAIGEISTIAGPAVPTLLKHLADETQHVRRAVKQAVEKLQTCGAIMDLHAFGAPGCPFLEEQLWSEDWRTRYAACWAWGTVGAAFAVAARKLLEGLSHRDWCVRLLSVEALGNLGMGMAPALPMIARLLDDEEEGVRQASKVVLAQYCAAMNSTIVLPETPYIQKIEMKLQDDDPQVREDATEELCNLGGARAASTIPQIIAMLLRETDGKVVHKGLEALDRFLEDGFLGDFGGVDEYHRPVRVARILTHRLKDEKWPVRLAAAESLGNLLAKVAPVVVTLGVRGQAAEGVQGAYEYKESSKRMLEWMRKDGAMVDLGEVLDKVLPVLARFAAHPDDGIHTMAMTSLRKIQQAGLLDDPHGHLDRAERRG